MSDRCVGCTPQTCVCGPSYVPRWMFTPSYIEIILVGFALGFAVVAIVVG